MHGQPPSDPIHEESIEIIENLGRERKISQAALIEFDLLMKSRGFSYSERIKTWSILKGLISIEVIEILSPLDIIVATYLVEKYGMDYFDSLIASQCITRKASPITTDKNIESIVLKAQEIITELRKLGIEIH